MPVSDPNQCRDHSADWTKYFYWRRGKDILAMVNNEIIAEHAANADEHLGPHSDSLQTVLNYFRAQPVLNKEFVYAVRPYQEYRLGRIKERGAPAEILDKPVFATEIEAMHATFLARIQRLRKLVEGGQP
jgi:hypothetical protein